MQITEADIGRLYGVNYDHRYHAATEQAPLIRHLTNWTLLKHASPIPQPLPISGEFEKDFVIQGSLLPESNQSTSSNHQDLIQVLLSSIKSWVIDRSHDNRGIYVQTSTAFYWLKEPCKDTVDIGGNEQAIGTPNDNQPSTNITSQEIIHQPIRAKFGLLSNLIDMFSDQNYNFVNFYAKRSITNTHCLLRPNAEILARYDTSEEPLNKEPFDLNLLKQFPEFVRRNMENLHDMLPNECVFFYSIKEFEQQFKERQRKLVPWSDEEYIESAEASESRSGRHSWGELKPNVKKARPNRLIEIRIMESHHLHKLEMSRKATSTSQEMTSQEMDEGQRLFLDECIADSSKLKVLHQSEIYSKSEIVKSISGLSNLLVPTPMEGEEDYKRFAVLDNNARLFIDEIVTNEVASLELMLLTLETISRSGQKVMKSMFQKKEKLTNCAGFIIFKVWLSYVIKVMAQRRKDPTSNLMDGNDMRTEELVAMTIMSLICNFSVINERKQIDILKSKFGVDLFDLVEKVLSFASFHNIGNVEIACRNAQVHLSLIKDDLHTTIDKPHEADNETHQEQRLEQRRERPHGSFRGGGRSWNDRAYQPPNGSYHHRSGDRGYNRGRGRGGRFHPR